MPISANQPCVECVKLFSDHAMLTRLLERQFGVLPGWAIDRISAADTATLEKWGLRVVDAKSLQDVFD